MLACTQRRGGAPELSALRRLRSSTPASAISANAARPPRHSAQRTPSNSTLKRAARARGPARGSSCAARAAAALSASSASRAAASASAAPAACSAPQAAASGPTSAAGLARGRAVGQWRPAGMHGVQVGPEASASTSTEVDDRRLCA